MQHFTVKADCKREGSFTYYPVDVVSLKSCTKKDFNERYLLPGVPCIFEDLMAKYLEFCPTCGVTLTKGSVFSFADQMCKWCMKPGKCRCCGSLMRRKNKSIVFDMCSICYKYGVTRSPGGVFYNENESSKS